MIYSKDLDVLNDSLNISIKFKNGSIGKISYYANGNTNLFLKNMLK